MFEIVYVSEVGCCDDPLCSGVSNGDMVHAILDLSSGTLIDFDEIIPNIGLYQSGTYHNSVGSASSFRDQVEEALSALIFWLEQ